MKRRSIANLVMAVLIVAIAAAGILGVGCIQGWFEKADGTQAVLQDMRGVIHLKRNGVSYPVTQNTVLRAGDTVTCQSGATAVISLGADCLILGEKASVTVQNSDVDAFCAHVHSGEIFAHCEKNATLCFEEQVFAVHQTTALFSVRSGAQSVSVLRGTVDGVNAGQILQFIGDKKSVSTLALSSLNDFTIRQIRNLNDATLCFTPEDLDRLAADRQQALEELINGQTKPTAPTTEPPETTAPPETTVPPETTAPPETTEPQTTPPETTVPPETTAPPQTVPPETTTLPIAGSCILSIYCDTILNNMGSLAPGKAEFVPEDGVILMPLAVNFYDGETVFDVLKRVCDRAGIQIEYSWTSLYDSYYVEGINNLYEFDCGFTSGWMYKVNGWFPNYGCSDYTLKDGDVIVWCYTCEGLGTDVGAPEME